MADEKPIIVIKKKGGHGGHHGGAWKVAYADFVTAMMAFFMVMWLVNTADVVTKQNIASYFRRPGVFESGSGAPTLTGGAGILPDAYVPVKPEEKLEESGSEIDRTHKHYYKDANEFEKAVKEELDKQLKVLKGGKGANDLFADNGIEDIGASTLDRAELDDIANQIKQQILSIPELEQLLGVVDVKVDANGLNIEIMDTEKSSMFERGSSVINPLAKEAFGKLTTLLAKFPNRIEVVGHTDGKPYPARAGGYSNWELSTDRANAARKILEGEGIGGDRIRSVVGRADTDLKVKEDPFAAANRRITLKVRFTEDRTVDLSKDPSKVERALTDAQPTPVAVISPVAASSAAPAASAEPIHAMTAEEIVKGANSKKTIPLPHPSAIPQRTPDYIGKDKLFGDYPVLGPSDILGK